METLKKNKVLSIVTLLIILLFLASNLCIINIYPKLELIVYVVLCLVPLVVVGVIGSKLLDKLYQKILLWAILFLILCFIILHSGIESNDYSVYLLTWYEGYANVPVKDALYKITDISNYTPFYNYILIILAKLKLNPLLSIKYITFLSSFLLAYSIEKIITNIRGSKFNFLRFASVLILPPVLLEYTAWGQCDAIYTSFALLSFYFALNKKSKRSFLFIGLSFITKLQFLFIVPILFIMLIVKDENGEKYLKWRDIWIAPSMYIINLVPALAGKSVIELLLIYLQQSVYDLRLSGNCANIAYCFQELNFPYAGGIIYVLLFIITFIIMASLIIFILKCNEKQNLTKEDFVFFGMVFSFIMVFFMPKMLDRFYFISMCLSFIYLFIKPSKVSFLSFILNLNALYFMMSKYLINTIVINVIFGFFGVVSAIINIVLIAYCLYKNYYQRLFKKNKLSHTSKERVE